eukprot:TRINITY_DN23132_c0_g1_i2.p1 TRINITY_DN23132_c0_g1~~TRINITY_DN23132_c0_g1_i2.p1  ORF type:complete len:281 (-),score=21.96 TRINITY_DN23132_c0_g1_i2:54-896(-)
MACSELLPGHAMHEHEVSIRFANFSSDWDAKKSTPRGIVSDSFRVAYASMHVQLKEAEAGHVALFLCMDIEDVLVLELSSSSVRWNGKTLMLDRRYFTPSWGPDFEFPEVAPITIGKWGRGWRAWQPVQEVLAHAEQHGDAVVLELGFHARVAHPCHDFSHCLELPEAVSLAVWSDQQLVKLRGTFGFEVHIPSQALRHHSAVLAAALDSEMKEGQSKVVKMADVDKRTLEDLRDCFLKGGVLRRNLTDWRRLLDLLVVAKKYEMTSLVGAYTFFLRYSA